jgi:hypothetical protein
MRAPRAQGGTICFSSSTDRPATSSAEKAKMGGMGAPDGRRVVSSRSSSKKGWASLHAAAARCSRRGEGWLRPCGAGRAHQANSRLEGRDAALRVVRQHAHQQVDALVGDGGSPLADALHRHGRVASWGVGRAGGWGGGGARGPRAWALTYSSVVVCMPGKLNSVKDGFMAVISSRVGTPSTCRRWWWVAGCTQDWMLRTQAPEGEAHGNGGSWLTREVAWRRIPHRRTAVNCKCACVDIAQCALPVTRVDNVHPPAHHPSSAHAGTGRQRCCTPAAQFFTVQPPPHLHLPARPTRHAP